MRLSSGSSHKLSVNIIGVISVFAIFLALNHLRNENHLYLRVFLAFSLLVLFIGLLMTRIGCLIACNIFCRDFILLQK